MVADIAANLSEKDRQILDEQILLLALPGPNGEFQAISVPRKIKFMSKTIEEALLENPSLTQFETNMPLPALQLIINYCHTFDYLKVTSTIEFPAVYNRLEKNVSPVEFNAISSVKDNFKELNNLFVFAKKLQIEAFYQLVAITIACYFKSHESMDLHMMLASFNKPEIQSDTTFLEGSYPFVFDEEKRANTRL